MSHAIDPRTMLHTYPHLTTLTTRYGDLDADGLLSETGIARYVEQARSRLMVEALQASGIDLHAGPLGMLIASIKLALICHRAPASEICLATGVSRIGTSSIDLRVGIFSDDLCLAVAENVMVIIARDSGRPMPLPAMLREKLQADACR